MKAYPSHAFVIDFEEMVDIGLPARRPENGDEADAVKELARGLLVLQSPLHLFFEYSTDKQAQMGSTSSDAEAQH